MKKILIMLFAAGIIISLSAGDVFARGIGVKGGYTWMREDNSDVYENNWNGGVFFDMGSFIFQSLKFRPGLDYVNCEGKNNNLADHEVWGIHFDWYWHFLGDGALSPFIGFGPTLNYLNWDDSNADEDSDAGVDVFAGLMLGIAGTPLDLILEARYKFIDIADRDDAMFQANLGILFKF